jgi:hypothetical protein
MIIYIHIILYYINCNIYIYIIIYIMIYSDIYIYIHMHTCTYTRNTRTLLLPQWSSIYMSKVHLAWLFKNTQAFNNSVAGIAKDIEIPTASPTARPSVVRGKPSASARCLQLSSWWDQWGCLPERYAGYLGSTKVGWKNYATLSTIQDRFLINFDHLETIEEGIWASLTKGPQSPSWLIVYRNKSM